MCPRYPQDKSKICPKYALDMPKICPRYAQDTPKLCRRCQRCAQDTPKTWPRYGQDMTKSRKHLSLTHSPAWIQEMLAHLKHLYIPCLLFHDIMTHVFHEIIYCWVPTTHRFSSNPHSVARSFLLLMTEALTITIPLLNIIMINITLLITPCAQYHNKYQVVVLLITGVLVCLSWVFLFYDFEIQFCQPKLQNFSITLNVGHSSLCCNYAFLAVSHGCP